MKIRPVLLAGVPTALEVKLRSAVPEASWAIMPTGSRDAVKESAGSTAVVFLGGELEHRFSLVRDLDRGGVRVIVVGVSKDADLILRAMREGAKEFVLANDEAAVARAIREQARPTRAEDVGAVHCVFAAKGGVGATTVAVNIAGVLQRQGKRTCLVDLNLNMGDVLAFLDLPGGYSIADVIANMRRLDRELLDSTMVKHSSGVHVLSQSHRVEEGDRVDASALTGLLNFLRQQYDAIVLDGLRSFDDFSLAAVDASDRILLVLTQEVPAVRDARRCVELLRRLGHERKLRVVVNRFQKQPDITLDVVNETVGVPVAATVANDYPAVIRAVNHGVLVVDDSPRSPVAKELQELVKLLQPEDAEKAPAARTSILKRFFAGKVSHAT